MRFSVRYHRPTDLVADFEQQFCRGGMLVRVDPPAGLALYDPAQLEVSLGEDSLMLSGQIVQMFPGAGTAISFPVEAALLEMVERARTAGAGEPRDPDHQLVPDGASTAEGSTTGAGRPRRAAPMGAAEKMQTAGKADKIKMAKHGSRDERMQILRSNDRALHPHVLRNPGLRLDEVAFIARMTTLSPEMYKQVAERREWAERPDVALSLVRNPKVPVPIAIKMLSNLRPTDLRQLAKSSKLRMPILQAARKKVVTR